MLTIAKNSDYRVVFAPDIPPVRLAAEEFIYYTALLTGAHLQAVPVAGGDKALGDTATASGRFAVYVGPLSGARQWIARVPRRSEPAAGREECRCVVEGDRMVLSATTPFALLHGVYRLLERFGGIRWINRLEGDEHVPRIGAFEVPDGACFWRARYRARAFTNYPEISPQTADFLDWMAKNGFNQFMVNVSVPGAWDAAKEHLLEAARVRGMELTVGHHTFDFWLPPAEFFEDHPEYFALIDGERRADGQLCTSNEAVRRIVAERIVAFLHENPDIREVALWPRDGYGWCQCEACLAEEKQRPSWWSESQPRRTDTYFRFVNAVAEMVAQEVPEARITALAYVNYAEPPEQVRLADNVVVYFVPFQRCFKHALGDPRCRRRNREYGEMLERWAEIAPGRLRLFAYLMQIDTMSLPYRLTEMLPENFAFLEKIGVDGWVMEYDVREWATFSANAYLIGHLAWESDRGVPEGGEKWLREELYRALYGPAADLVGQYWTGLAAAMVEQGPCTGHYDLKWTMRATPGYLQGPLGALGRARAAAAIDRAAWRAVERACVAAELLLRVGEWQRRMADLAKANDFTRPRRLKLAQEAAQRVIEWAEKWADSGAVNAEKVARRVRREMERIGGAAGC